MSKKTLQPIAGPYVELENYFLIGSTWYFERAFSLTDIKGDSEAYASFVAVLENNVDGSFYFDAIRSIAGRWTI
jgi:hypothetical protein